jgi:hypothetical protein
VQNVLAVLCQVVLSLLRSVELLEVTILYRSYTISVLVVKAVLDNHSQEHKISIRLVGEVEARHGVNIVDPATKKLVAHDSDFFVHDPLLEGLIKVSDNV